MQGTNPSQSFTNTIRGTNQLCGGHFSSLHIITGCYLMEHESADISMHMFFFIFTTIKDKSLPKLNQKGEHQYVCQSPSGIKFDATHSDTFFMEIS